MFSYHSILSEYNSYFHHKIISHMWNHSIDYASITDKEISKGTNLDWVFEFVIAVARFSIAHAIKDSACWASLIMTCVYHAPKKLSEKVLLHQLYI